MATGHTPLHADGPNAHIEFDKRKLAFGAEALAVACQVTVSVLSLTSQTKVLFFIIFTLIGVGVLVWWSGQSPKAIGPRSTTNILMGLLLFGAVLALGIMALPTIIKATTAIPPPAKPVTVKHIPTYFLKVHVYRDDGRTGEQDGTDPALPDVLVAIRDQFGTNSTYRTGRDGDAIVRLPHIGEISVGVCRNFQTHEVTEDNDAANRASNVKVGIDPPQVDTCRE